MWFPQYESNEQRFKRERDQLQESLYAAIDAVSDGHGLKVGLAEDIQALRDRAIAAESRVAELSSLIAEPATNPTDQTKETP